MDGIQVFLEGKESWECVGLLTRSDDFFVFRYDDSYVNKSDSIPLGPELPLSKEIYRSKELFVPFSERIPPKNSSAYPDYCKAKGISVDESDVFILLSTLGHRGPSSLIFEPRFKASAGQ